MTTPATMARTERSAAAECRLAIFTTHPIQYQAPLFRELAARPGLHPIVLFGSRHGLDPSLDKGFGARFQWDIPLLDGYDHAFIENVAANSDVDRFGGIRVRDAKQILREHDADAVLVLGWQSIAHLQFMRAAHALGLPLLMRGESNLLRRLPPGLKARIRSLLWVPARKLVYRAMFARVSEFLVIGSRNADFYRHFGVPDEKLQWAPYAVDNERFALPFEEHARARRSRREELGISEDVVIFLDSAKLIPRKRPLDLLAAFDKVVRVSENAHLIFLGSGPLQPAIEAEIDARGLQGRVSITGFVNQREIPTWYAAADCLVLPSDSLETWGLAVNEGMAAGLAAIVSADVGCAPDLVRAGENGFQFPLGDISALAERMIEYAQLARSEREAMSRRSRAIVGEFSIDRVADAVVTALAVAAP